MSSTHYEQDNLGRYFFVSENRNAKIEIHYSDILEGFEVNVYLKHILESDQPIFVGSFELGTHFQPNVIGKTERG